MVLFSNSYKINTGYEICANELSVRSLARSIRLSAKLTGPSVVRPVRDAALRNQVLQSSGLTRAPIETSDSEDSLAAPSTNFLAGQKILLECVTPDPGRPRASAWLWFRNGQPIDDSKSKLTSQANNSNPSKRNDNNVRDSAILDDNPISGLDLSSAPANGMAQRRQQHVSASGQGKNEAGGAGHENEESAYGAISGATIAGDRELESASAEETMKLLGAGRYLFIPSIQLVHKGNYSCVALNRFGSGPQQSKQQQQSAPSSNRMERDHWYNLNVALAPSFVQPLPPRTYWSEISTPPPFAKPPTQSSTSDGQIIAELVCHVQCDPICNIEWLRNGQPIEPKGKWLEQEQLASSSNYVSHQIRQSILDENLEANLLRSIESRLILKHQQQQQQHMGPEDAVFARERVLARRSYLNGSNYTCQSTSNSMGPGVGSSSKFVVQYAPENVLINAPSDKLSLVEGSNGPRLSCEAAGEPQVQYRWLLVKSSGSDLATSKHNNRLERSSPLALSSSIGIGSEPLSSGEQDRATNQLEGGARSWIEPAGRGSNDVPPMAIAAAGLDGNAIELAGSISDQRGVSISTLDLSQLSLDRKQSGHYVCEVSNKLGQSRQSVYVNVLYKPTCSGLHLHSLDMLMAPPNANDIKQSDIRVKPLRASANDEYTLVRENSDDFINLRKTLVISPLLNGHLTTSNTQYGELETGELSLRGSIFQSILDDKKTASMLGIGLLAKDKSALFHSEDSGVSSEINNALSSHDELKRPNHDDSLAGPAFELGSKSQGSDAWNRFNALLLKFLNTYVRQVRNHQASQVESLAADLPREDSPRDKRQNPRGSSRPVLGETPDRLSRGDFGSLPLNQQQQQQISGLDTATKNLLTFACMAQDGNPMGNLSFDWSFGSVNLAESNFDSIDLESRQADELGNKYGQATGSKPQLLYVNANRTVSVMLIRRLDTHSILSPFQMSLLTLNVVVDQRPQSSTAERPPEERGKVSKREAEAVYIQANERHPTHQAKAPVIRSRVNNINNNNHRVNQNSGKQQASPSSIQFAAEFETARHPSMSPSYHAELDEYNWQERLGALLNCRVSNQMGTSDVCHVRVNLAERLKNLSLSESEFAKWRMPSLAQKSLLIVSILVGCALIVFSASALLIGPYLRALSYKSSGEPAVHESGENNTRQSTSSQKSSVLGLLTNGDSSLQGSSDEDSNGRSNHTDDNGPPGCAGSAGLQPLNLGGSSLSGIVSNCGYQYTASGHNHYRQSSQLGMLGAESLMANYDKPRRLKDNNLAPRTAANHQSGPLGEQIPDRDSNNTAHYLESFALSGDSNSSNNTNNKVEQYRERGFNATTADHSNRTSTGSKILASLKLKSLSKFKADKISDQTSLASHLADLKSYHARSASGMTNTTGMSNLCLDSDLTLSMTSQDASASSMKYFGSPAFRRSYTNARRTTNDYPTADNSTQKRYNQAGPLSIGASMHDQRLAQKYVESEEANSMIPTYSNLNQYEPYNAMDEFIRRKELESSLQIGGSKCDTSQSIRYRIGRDGNGTLAPVPKPKLYDLKNLYSPQMMRPQPYYLSDQQSHTMTLQRYDNMPPNHRPSVTARPPRRLIHQESSSVQQYQMPANNRYSMPASAQIPTVNSNIVVANTIDSHLDNFASTLAAEHYNNSGRFAPPVSSGEMRQLAQNIYGHSNQQQDQRSPEHIYDVNAYATPEQTPKRGQNNIGNYAQDVTAPRSRVGQLIQTFNSSLPE